MTKIESIRGNKIPTRKNENKFLFFFQMEYWNLIEHSNKLYDSGKYKAALQEIRRARELEPEDLLIDYSEAGILFAMGEFVKADAIYHKLLSIDENEFVRKSGGRGKLWCNTIRLDCIYERARCRISMDDYIFGIALMKEHLARRRKGLYSDFRKKEVEDDLFVREIELKYDVHPIPDSSRLMNRSQSKKFSEHLKELWNSADLKKIKRYLLRKLDTFPDEYFLHLSLADVYERMEDTPHALVHAEAAFNQAEYDPLCIYTYSKLLMMNCRFLEALDIVNRLLNTELKEIAYGPNGEGMRWAKSIFNDALYIKSFSLNALGEKEQSFTLINEHKSHRKGIYSDFSIRQVKVLLELCHAKDGT